jgi:hypothetical protein
MGLETGGTTSPMNVIKLSLKPLTLSIVITPAGTFPC